MTNSQDYDPNERPTHLGEWMRTALDSFENPGGGPQSVRTGFRDLDALTGGLHPGTLTVIASRPGIGRTTLLSDICRRVAIGDSTPVAAWTLEESGEEFTTRVLCAEARVARHHVTRNCLDEDAWTRLGQTAPHVSTAPLYLKAPAALAMAELRAEALEHAEEDGLRLIAVDGIQDIKPDRRSDLREREVGDVVRELKSLARELNVPVLATSHLNRGAEQRYDRRPMLDDLRESGAITYAADTIILLHRDDAYERESARAGEADLIVAKHRQGPTAVITLAFQAHYGRFVDMPEGWLPDPSAARPFDFGALFAPKRQETTPEPEQP